MSTQNTVQAVQLGPSPIISGHIQDLDMMVEWGMSTLFAAYMTKGEMKSSKDIAADISAMALSAAKDGESVMLDTFTSLVIEKAYQIIKEK